SSLCAYEDSIDRSRWCFLGLRVSFPGLGLMLPPPMEPEVLGRVLEDEAFQGRGESLREDANISGSAGQGGGVDDILTADLVAKAGADPPRDADDDRRLVLNGQERNRLVGRG